MLSDKEILNLYTMWKKDESIVNNLSKITTPEEMAQLYDGFQKLYYTEFPLVIPPDSPQGHFNGLKEIGVEDYKIYNTFTVILNKNSGKTYHFFLQ